MPTGTKQVSPAAFNTYFPDADAKVFEIIDGDHDGVIRHEEGHRFKEAHGMGHHKRRGTPDQI